MCSQLSKWSHLLLQASSNESTHLWLSTTLIFLTSKDSLQVQATRYLNIERIGMICVVTLIMKSLSIQSKKMIKTILTLKMNLGSCSTRISFRRLSRESNRTWSLMMRSVKCLLLIHSQCSICLMKIMISSSRNCFQNESQYSNRLQCIRLINTCRNSNSMRSEVECLCTNCLRILKLLLVDRDLD